jgi:hypothetical protein
MLTAAELRKHVSYDPETGVFLRVHCPRRPDLVGKQAGTFDSKGARQINIGGRLYLAHRLAWLYINGSMPSMDIDHKDGDPSNNRWENLREATDSQNQANSKRPKNNTSGSKGVWREMATGRWNAYLNAAGKRIYLGTYDTVVEASAAYLAGARQHFGEFARAA